MTENEEKSIGLCLGFYAKWREDTIETGEQWIAFAEDLQTLAAELDKVQCPIGKHLFDAVVSSFDDLYRNGMKPVKVGFFGRSDL